MHDCKSNVALLVLHTLQPQKIHYIMIANGDVEIVTIVFCISIRYPQIMDRSLTVPILLLYSLHKIILKKHKTKFRVSKSKSVYSPPPGPDVV